MKNVSQYNILIQTKFDFEGSECSERYRYTIEQGTNINQIHSEDIRNKDSISINKKEKNNENSETENISNDKNQGLISNEHTQRSRDHSSTTSLKFFEVENKKNILRNL